ncbi:ribonuclease E inhibitor RraB, partial [Akkermansiaceae bacterium]|nr:ribonuclease E inhibitor RraB [Akkermansiaceae bacterium]
SLGPTADDYGKDRAVYRWNEKERALRAPIKHLSSIKSPMIIAEGRDGNYESLMKLKKADKKPNIKVVVVDQANHFQLIHPFNRLVSRAITDSKDGTLDLSESKLKTSYIDYQLQQREATDLEILSDLRSQGIEINKPQIVTFFLFSNEKLVESVREKVGALEFEISSSEKFKRDDGTLYYVHELTKTLIPADLTVLFAATAVAEKLADSEKFFYDDWTIR